MESGGDHAIWETESLSINILNVRNILHAISRLKTYEMEALGIDNYCCKFGFSKSLRLKIGAIKNPSQ